MTREEAIETSLWACMISGRESVYFRIQELFEKCATGEQEWGYLSSFLLEVFPENPALADGVFNG